MHQRESLALYLLYHDAEDGLLCLLRLGEEYQTRAILPLLGDRDALQQDKLVRNLEHDARSIARLVVSALGSAVAHILKHLQGIVHQFMALVAMYVDNHTHATGVVLIIRLVQSFIHSMLLKGSKKSLSPFHIACKITKILAI